MSDYKTLDEIASWLDEGNFSYQEQDLGEAVNKALGVVWPRDSDWGIHLADLKEEPGWIRVGAPVDVTEKHQEAWHELPRVEQLELKESLVDALTSSSSVFAVVADASGIVAAHFVVYTHVYADDLSRTLLADKMTNVHVPRIRGVRLIQRELVESEEGSGIDSGVIAE